MKEVFKNKIFKIMLGAGIVIGAIGIFSCSMEWKTVQAANSYKLTEDDYTTVVEETIALAEFFRADESFIYEANSCLTKEQVTLLKSELIPQIFTEANATTEAEKVNAILSFVRSHMTEADKETVTLCSNTYEMLWKYPEENDGAYFVGDSYNYTLAVRDLCALSGIPAILVGDENNYTFHDYQIVMVYIDGTWKFIDAFNESSDIMAGADLYAALNTIFEPAKMNFGYTKGNSIINYAGSIFINETMYSWDNGNNLFNLMYDKDKKAVLKMFDSDIPLPNSYYYGSLHKTDSEGKVPTGMLDCTIIDGAGEGIWRFCQSYSQYGVLLQGWVEIDGVEHNFSEFEGAYTLHYYEVVEDRAPTEEEESAANQDVYDRVELCAKIGEALAADAGFSVFMDYTDEELAYMKSVAEEAVTAEWVMKNETDEAIKNTPEDEYTDYLKAQGLVNWLKSNIRYIDGIVYQDVYTTLYEKKGTCANYASSLTELCTFFNIPCYTLSGKSSNSRAIGGQVSDHAYNILKLDGKWYVSDPTNDIWIREIGTTTHVKPSDFDFGRFFQKDVYISYEMMLRDLNAPITGLCYDFDEEGNLEIYYMNRTGPIANYKGKEFSTDENGKLLQNNGFVSWEEKIETEAGYEIWVYEGYSCQGYTIGGPQTINGKEYPFPRERDMAALQPIGYPKEKKESHYDITELEHPDIATSYTYTGDYICPEIVLKNGDTTLVEGVDYNLTFYNNKNISSDSSGRAYFIIEGMGEYYDRYPVYFDIVAKEITESDVSFSQTDFQWNIEVDKEGGFSWPEVTVNAPENNYTISYSGFSGMTQGTVLIKGRYNCTGEVKKVFPLKPMSIEDGDFKVEIISDTVYSYRGVAIEPTVKVTWYAEDGTVYRELDSTEYDITYENNTNVGTAKIIIEGCDHFTGKLETTFEITKRDLSNDSRLKEAIASTWPVTYTGEAITPTIPGINYFSEYTSNTGYVLDKDYTMSITNNVDAGQGTITLEGIGNYCGSKTGTFTISPKEIAKEELYLAEMTTTYTGEVESPEVVIGTLQEGKDFKASCYIKKYDETGENYEYIPTEPIECGVYHIKVELLTSNHQFWYYETEKWLTYFIEEATVQPPSGGNTGSGTSGSGTSNSGNSGSGSENAGAGSSDTGNSGSESSGSNTNNADIGNNTSTTGGASLGTNNSVDNSQNTNGNSNLNSENVTENSPNSQAQITVSKVKKLKIKKQKKALLVNWKNVKNANGYQLQFSTNKKFKKAKKVTLSSKKKSYKLKNPKKKKTYFVRVRAYRTYQDANGKTKKVYGKWTVVKKRV